MPKLIKNVEGELFDNNIADVNLVKSVSGEIQGEDYINLNGFIAYLQNFSKTEETVVLTKPNNFGLSNINNIQMITLEIDY